MPFDPSKLGSVRQKASGFNPGLLGQVAAQTPSRLNAAAPAPAGQPAQDVPANRKGLFGFFSSVLAPNLRNLGDTLGGLYGQGAKETEELQEAIRIKNDLSSKLAKSMKERSAKGLDVSKHRKLLQENIDFNMNPENDPMNINPVYKKTEKQIVGEFYGAGLDVGTLLAGTKVGSAAMGVAAPEKYVKLMGESGKHLFGRAVVAGAKRSAPIGVGYGLSAGLQQDKDIQGILAEGVKGGIVSSVFGGLIEGTLGYRQGTATIRAQAKKQAAIQQYKLGLQATKEKYQEKADQIIPQLLKDKTWGTQKQLLEKANRGIALSEVEYKKLGELQGVIGIDGLVEKIDDQINNLSRGGRNQEKFISSVSSTYTNHFKTAQDVLDNVPGARDQMGQLIGRTKENIVLQLRAQGASALADKLDDVDVTRIKNISTLKQVFEKEATAFVQPISTNTTKVKALMALKNDILSLEVLDNYADKNAYQQDLRELASQYGKKLYDTRKSIKTVTDNEALSRVRQIDSAIRDLLGKKNPEFAAINKVYTLNTRLADTLLETMKRDSSGRGFTKFQGLISAIIGASSGLARGSITEAVLGAGALSGITQIINSTWWNTLRAVQKNNAADKLMQMSSQQRSHVINLIQQRGYQAAKELGIID